MLPRENMESASCIHGVLIYIFNLKWIYKDVGKHLQQQHGVRTVFILL